MNFACLKKSEVDRLFAEINELKSLIIDIQKKQISEQWVESKDVPALLGISHRTWQKLRDDRKISFTQFGRKIMVKMEDLNQFMITHSIIRK